MTHTPRHIPVSLILTTRNESSHVALFLDGMRAQSVQADEIVICDGGSTDDTVARLHELGADLPLRVIVEDGANIARGRNCALRAAKHDILAFTDAGCIIEPEWLERITAPLLENTIAEDTAVDAVSGGYTLIGDTRIQRWARAAELPLSKQDPEHFLPSSRSFAARRAAVERAGLYPEHLTFAGEDTALVLRMREQGARFVTRWDALVHWYPRPTLRQFLRQHYLYGLGDGEAHNNSGRYLKTGIKWLLVLGHLLPVLWYPWLLLLLPAALLLYGFRLAPSYGWSKLPLSDRVGGFFMILLKEISMSAGFLVGRLRGPRGGKPE